jgi:hypothetical protein
MKSSNKNKKEYLMLLLKIFAETIKEEHLENLDLNDLDGLVKHQMSILKLEITKTLRIPEV